MFKYYNISIKDVYQISTKYKMSLIKNFIAKMDRKSVKPQLIPHQQTGLYNASIKKSQRENFSLQKV